MKTTLGILAGKASHSSFQKWDVVQPCLEKLPLNLTKIFLDTLAKGTTGLSLSLEPTGKTLTTADGRYS